MDEVIKLNKQLTITRIVAVILFLFCVCFIFAQIQRMEADKYAELAIKCETEASQLKDEARRQTDLAMQQRAEAEHQRVIAVQNAELAQTLAAKQKKK